jgi:hypothetical protein
MQYECFIKNNTIVFFKTVILYRSGQRYIPPTPAQDKGTKKAQLVSRLAEQTQKIYLLT